MSTLDHPVTIATSLTIPGAVLLISCYELGHQPLNLASPIAHLRRAGFAPVAVDTAVDTLDDRTIRRAGLVAISVPMHTALRLGARIAARVREVNPDAHICCYGLYATLNADHLLDHGVDSVIGGEYEAALVELARALDTGGDQVVPGVGRSGAVAPPVLERLPRTEPDRSALPPLRRYAGLERNGAIVRAGYVEATRGCHHTCLHCPITPIYQGRFFAVPRSVVVADARAQIEAGARHLTFGDPDFFNGPTHGLRIMREVRADNPVVTFDATIKIEHLLQHRRLVPDLAELGCAFVLSAVETLSDHVLDKLKKGHARADVETALAILDESGIPMRPSLLPFTPWETLDGYLTLLRFVADHGLIHHVDPVHFSIRLLVPPGSALLDEPDSAKWVGDLDAANFTHRWRHPDPRMDELQQTVARIAERAALDVEDAERTFARIWDAAHEAVGLDHPPVPRPLVLRPRPPRLTENWFC
ncbi:MAG: CUAEP/CCAEP-tail radical SAM (seleno)protein [Thermomicrobiales bacterium]